VLLSGQGIELRVWFERRGYVKDEQIVWAPHRREVDPSIMSEQGALDGGALIGTLRLDQMSDDQAHALVEDRRGDPGYLELGKWAVSQIIHPKIERLVNLLRTTYGQYWVAAPERWDSRKLSLGHYCHVILQTRWSLDGGASWHEFCPDEPTSAPISVTWNGVAYRELLTEADWRALGDVYMSDLEPGPAALAFARAREIFGSQDLATSSMAAVTALELAMGEFLQRQSADRKPLADAAAKAKDLPMDVRLFLIGSTYSLGSDDELEQALEVIRIRNEAVHQAKMPRDGDEKKVETLLRVISRMLPGPPVKLAIPLKGGTRMSPQHWEELYERGRLPSPS
jgi:hypothetical protein